VGRRHRDRQPVGDGPGPVEAFVLALYDEHARNLLGYFQSRTFCAEVAADLTAETFAAAIDSHERYDPERGEPGAWLWGIARHLLYGFQRSAEVERRARERLALRTPSVAVDDLDLVDDRCDAESLSLALERSLGALSDGVAAAVRARVVDQLSYREVALRLGCSEAAARTRVSRGLTQLLDGMDGLDGEELS
jgi:RNA polymerase sigma-70 factor (ECF subfamily)